jgi:hypothetical protein
VISADVTLARANVNCGIEGERDPAFRRSTAAARDPVDVLPLWPAFRRSLARRGDEIDEILPRSRSPSMRG